MARILLSHDPSYAVFLLYQKEVQNADHAYFQSMLDWLHVANDSPYKLRSRNTASMSISSNGVQLRNEFSYENELYQQLNSWHTINFKLKHLKEIYVDKRHKDTCVLVSKISSSTLINYVYKQANPFEFQEFLDDNNNSNNNNQAIKKKSYLITVLKFREGPIKLLQLIQNLDKILSSSQDTSKQTRQTVDLLSNEEKVNRRKLKQNSQLYLGENYAGQQQQIFFINNQQQPNNNGILTNRFSINSQSSFTKYNPPENNLSLPRPLSASSIKDLRPFTPLSSNGSDLMLNQSANFNSRHSLTPTSFNHMQLRQQQQQIHPSHQQGLYPMKRSSSRLSQHSGQANASFENLSEIGYQQYQKKVEKTSPIMMQHGVQPQHYVHDNMASETQLRRILPSPTGPPNGGSIRVSRNTRPVSMFNNVQLNETNRSSSVTDRTSYAKSRSINERTANENYLMHHFNIFSEKTNIPNNRNVVSNEPKHQSFNGVVNKPKKLIPNELIQMAPMVLNKTSSDKKMQMTMNRKNLIIDANLDKIKAELDSLKLKKKIENEQLKQQQQQQQPEELINPYSTHSFSQPKTKQSQPSEPINNNNNNNNENIFAAAKPTVSYLKNNREPSRLKEIIDSFNNYEKNFVNQPDLNATALSKPVETAARTAADPNHSSESNLNGLIKYFSNYQPKEEVAAHANKTPNPALSQKTQKTTNLDTAKQEVNFSNLLDIDQAKASLESDSAAKPPASKLLSENILSMSIDSLESSVSARNEETKTAIDQSAYDVLKNELYNNVDLNKQEVVYDLATYGLDTAIIQGAMMPINNPPVIGQITRRAKSQQAGRKRTFANMVWPMDPEEERILRSNSPFVVPEVIVTRTDQVKSILKKNNILTVEAIENALSPPIYLQSPNSNKKRVDFHQNFLFVNVFEVVRPDVDANANVPPDSIKSQI